MTVQSEYQKKWYEENKERINTERRARYHEQKQDKTRHRAYLERRAKTRNGGIIPANPTVDTGVDPSTVPQHILTWLAALIDGEGTITLTKGGYSPSSVLKSPSLATKDRIRMSISVANTNYKLMEALVGRTGIDTIHTHRRPDGSKQKTLYTWRMNSTQIEKWLPFIRPWLVLKQEQADVLLEVIERKAGVTPRRGEKWDPPNSQEYRQFLLDAVERIRILNHRGVK